MCRDHLSDCFLPKFVLECDDQSRTHLQETEVRVRAAQVVCALVDFSVIWSRMRERLIFPTVAKTIFSCSGLHLACLSFSLV